MRQVIFLSVITCTKNLPQCQWIGADMPHKRKRMLKNHSELKAMAVSNSNAEDLYAPSLIDNFYPTRPSELENVRLYDFVAHYKYDGTDKNGERMYRKLTKLVLPNHKIFNPLKEEERQTELLLFTHDPVCSFPERSGIVIRRGNR